MQPKLVLTLFLSIISRPIAAFEYINTLTIESINILENPFFYGCEMHYDILNILDVILGGSYLCINKTITKNDNLYVCLSVNTSNGGQFSIPSRCIKLCDLLEEEATNSSSILSKLQLSRSFGLDGEYCPIETTQKPRKLEPYRLPQSTILFDNIGCGNLNCEVAIKNCQSVEKSTNCSTYFAANITLYLEADHC